MLKELVLFGSQAVGCSEEKSDWDFLAVIDYGETIMIPLKKANILRISEETLQSQTWLGSELALHIQGFGKWLKGVPWKNCYASEQAINNKRNYLLKHSSLLKKYWDKIGDFPRRTKYVSKLRRNLQRLNKLQNQEPTPPKQILDKEWNNPQTKKSVQLVFQAFQETMEKDVFMFFERVIFLDKDPR